jgi:hypothetical protein
MLPGSIHNTIEELRVELNKMLRERLGIDGLAAGERPPSMKDIDYGIWTLDDRFKKAGDVPADVVGWTNRVEASAANPA